MHQMQQGTRSTIYRYAYELRAYLFLVPIRPNDICSNGLAGRRVWAENDASGAKRSGSVRWVAYPIRRKYVTNNSAHLHGESSMQFIRRVNFVFASRGIRVGTSRYYNLEYFTFLLADHHQRRCYLQKWTVAQRMFHVYELRRFVGRTTFHFSRRQTVLRRMLRRIIRQAMHLLQ